MIVVAKFLPEHCVNWMDCLLYFLLYVAKGIFLTLGDRRWIATLGVELPTTLAGALVAAFGENIDFSFLIASFFHFQTLQREILVWDVLLGLLLDPKGILLVDLHLTLMAYQYA